MLRSPETVDADAYLAAEERAELRHEFVGGEVRRRQGGTANHSRLKGRLVVLLDRHRSGGGSEAFGSGARVVLPDRSQFRYPDAVVTRGRPEPTADPGFTISNPHALFEVMEHETEVEDRGERFEAYRQIPTLSLYVLIDSERVKVETFERRESGLWAIDSWDGPAAVAELDPLGISFPLSELYRDMSFEAKPEPTPRTAASDA